MKFDNYLTVRNVLVTEIFTISAYPDQMLLLLIVQ